MFCGIAVTQSDALSLRCTEHVEVSKWCTPVNHAVRNRTVGMNEATKLQRFFNSTLKKELTNQRRKALSQK